MGKTCGIRIAEQVLVELSTDQELKERLSRAIIELGVIVYENNENEDDVSTDDFNEIQNLKIRYNEIVNCKIVDHSKLDFLSGELSELCCTIIQTNTILQNLQL